MVRGFESSSTTARERIGRRTTINERRSTNNDQRTTINGQIPMILEQIRNRAAADLQHIILPEGDDVRTLQAAEICVRDGIAKITVIGAEENIRTLARESNVNLNGVEIIDHRKSPDLARIATLYYSMRRPKGVTLEEAEQTVESRSTLATFSSAKARRTARSPVRPTLPRIRSRRRSAASACDRASRSSRAFF